MRAWGARGRPSLSPPGPQRRHLRNSDPPVEPILAQIQCPCFGTASSRRFLRTRRRSGPAADIVQWRSLVWWRAAQALGTSSANARHGTEVVKMPSPLFSAQTRPDVVQDRRTWILGRHTFVSRCPQRWRPRPPEAQTSQAVTASRLLLRTLFGGSGMCGEDAEILIVALVGETGAAFATSDHLLRAFRTDFRCGVWCAGAE